MIESHILSQHEYEVVLRNDLMSFAERSFYELNPHSQFLAGKYIELLAATIEKCRKRQTKRLIINLPPRTLKSHVASVAFPAWLLGHHPATEIICASYGQELADKHARDCRNLMNSAFYRKLFPNTNLSPDRLAVFDFATTAKGFRMATSVGGVLTGRGADVIILDDIMKPDDALSENRRKDANNWYRNTLLSRLNSKENGVIIVVMQRLHESDLVGEVLEREEWEILSLPAIALRDEHYRYDGVFGPQVFSRKAGEALHPERDSVDTYLRIREAVGAYTFNSQYQQSPTSLADGLIKKEWIRFYEHAELPKEFDYVLQSWDTASKISQTNDYSVCTTWAISEQRFYLLDVFRKKCTFPQLKYAAIELFRKYDPLKVLIEDKSSGMSLIQELKYGGDIYCLEEYRPPVGSDKYMRLGEQSIKFEKGNVWLPKEALWLDEYIREIAGFPGTKYDDQVDSTSQALAILGSLAGVYTDFQGFGHPRVYESY